MTKTVIIHDVPSADLSTVLTDLERDGYNTSYYLEPDGEFTVIGTKEMKNAASETSTKKKSGTA
jgi:hypothetical protein